MGGWLRLGEYDLVIIADVPGNESMPTIALAKAARGAIKASKTTMLMTGTEGVGGMRKANAAGKVYGPERYPSRRTHQSLKPQRLFAAGLSLKLG